MKNKKSLSAIVALLLVAIVGATFAYFQTNASFVNVFNTGTYRVVTTEEFVGPENWAPGQEIPKTITSTNEGTIPAAVRVSYTEQWLKEIEGVETDITSQVSSGTVIINLDNTSEWIQEGNYYYYKYILDPTKTTSSFIKSVTLNPNMNGASCTQSGLTQICEASNVALGATYKLTITKETVQADKYQEVWNTNVEIIEKPEVIKYLTRQNEGQISIGDVIGIGETEDFYVISTNSEKTLLIAKYNLLVGNYRVDWNQIEPLDPSTTPGYGLQNEYAVGYQGQTLEYLKGMVPFSSDVYWDSGTSEDSNLISPYNSNGASYDGNPYPYVYDENCNLYQYISGEDGYVNKLISMGAPTNITGRLLSYEEAEFLRDNYLETIGNGSFWLGSVLNRNGIFMVWAVEYNYYYEFYEDNYNHNTYHGVRPVIEIDTSELQ